MIGEEESQEEKDDAYDKFYKYDMQLKKLEIQLGQKDLEIANLNNEVQKLQGTVDFRARAEAKDRERRAEMDAQMGSLPFMAENAELKRLTTTLKQANEKMKKTIKRLENELHTTSTENSSLNYRMNEYIKLEQIKWNAEAAIRTDNTVTKYVKVSNDTGLLGGMLGILLYVRESLCEVVLDLFVQSGDEENLKKGNSLQVFQENARSVFSNEVRGVVVPLYIYKKMKELVKIYYPDYGEMESIELEMQKIVLGVNEVKRDEVNTWVMQSMAIVKKKSAKKRNREKEENDLFRFLAILYRTRYPLSGLNVHIDQDIKVHLEDKIIDLMLKISLDEYKVLAS